MRLGVTATTMWSEKTFRNAGISRVSYQLVEQLSCRYPDDRIKVYTNTSFDAPERWRERENLQIFPVSPIGRGKKALWEKFGAGRFARRSNCDVWLSTAHSVPFRPQVPCVAFIHDMIPLSHPEFQDGAQSAYLRWALVHAAKAADRVLTNSETTKEEIVRFTAIDKRKVTVIPLGPGWELPIEPEPLSLELPFSKFALLEAISLLEREKKLGEFGLVAAGGRGWKDHGIFETLERLKIQHRVHFTGYVEDAQLPALLERCAAFVYPSLFEGFGMPIIEAMQAGAVVLTSNRGAMKEVGGDAAVYFDPTDPATIAATIERYALNGKDRGSLLARGHARAQMFSWEAAGDATMEVLRDLVSEASS
jgi:glycosyltransferase involved in cell wall biosynthesis